MSALVSFVLPSFNTLKKSNFFASHLHDGGAYLLSIAAFPLLLPKEGCCQFIFIGSWTAWLADLCPGQNSNPRPHDHPFHIFLTQARYDEELAIYMRETGLLASDIAKMRMKRPPHERSTHRATVRNTPEAAPAAAAKQAQAWPNGPVVPQGMATIPGVLPTLYANHDGTITVGGMTAVDHKGNTTATATVAHW